MHSSRSSQKRYNHFVGSHKCVKEKHFELMMMAYPHVCWRCKTCKSIVEFLPIDDAPADVFEIVMGMIVAFRKARGG